MEWKLQEVALHLGSGRGFWTQQLQHPRRAGPKGRGQIYWYRQGDLEPKFRNLIYYILFSIVMLCICANLYFHEVGK
ncbi:hypothetical protein llap_16541 [Limosa lapponica baueri]|uniref:Uncharacterized protein n=1 Tax=Limosa lapponica baueri TaxID=1758121 RepID=A0A2I0TH81_LIMLA|nr:hypothetical protein llap_16541 [Limosa lapponica baueri]